MHKLTASNERLGGVKYWAQWFPIYKKPQFDLYVYVGCDANIGQYYFANYRNPSTLVCRNFYQITRDQSFRPFLLENEHLDNYIESLKKEPPNAIS